MITYLFIYKICFVVTVYIFYIVYLLTHILVSINFSILCFNLHCNKNWPISITIINMLYLCSYFCQVSYFLMLSYYYLVPFSLNLKSSFCIPCNESLVVTFVTFFFGLACLYHSLFKSFAYFLVDSSSSTVNISFCCMLAACFLLKKNWMIILWKFPCMWLIIFL